ncbi:MAG: hypothetical protein IBX64_05780 [Actinobacteria bacterium]|nr:hypothetical protein [Actinomycetota bacterium]
MGIIRAMSNTREKKQHENSSHSTVLLIGIFVGAVMLTLLFGFFGYVILLIFLGLIIYLKGLSVRLPAGLKEGHIIDVLFMAIIVSLLLDVVQVASSNSATEYANRKKDTSSTTTTNRQAKGRGQSLPNSLVPQEDTSKVNIRQGNGSERLLLGSTTSLWQRRLSKRDTSDQRPISSYQEGSYTSGNRYTTGREKPSNEAIGTKTTIKRAPPPTTPPRSTVTTENRNSYLSHPLTKPGDGTSLYRQEPARPKQTIEKSNKPKQIKEKPTNPKLTVEKTDKPKPSAEETARQKPTKRELAVSRDVDEDTDDKELEHEIDEDSPGDKPGKPHKLHKPDKSKRPDKSSIKPGR